MVKLLGHTSVELLDPVFFRHLPSSSLQLAYLHLDDDLARPRASGSLGKHL
jgi:hypothetical protein